MAIKKSSSSGIPFGNNAGRPASPGIGQLYSNGEAQRLELYTAAGAWENIVQEVPGVSSITGNYSQQTDSGVITIYGTNFVNGAVATAIGADGSLINASSTTYNSLVQLTATFTGLLNAQEPYDIKVTNPSNLFGIIPDALYINASPVWQTASGSLGTFDEQVSISVSATGTDSDSTITYALASGSTLPSGVTLNSSTGVISGTLPGISTDTTYTFTINASDGVNSIPRTFNLISLNIITVPSVEYLVVAGGGGGGANGGYGSGGGAGGFRYGSIAPVSPTAYSVVVGLGGNGQVGANTDNSTVGGVSTFASITSAGGGRGRGVSGGIIGLPGGSGGGGDRNPGGASSPVTSPVQGYAGGGMVPGNNDTTGGGGGAGGVGGDGVTGQGGVGGPGAASSITGSSVIYAGGGGGSSVAAGGAGGSGIGGNAGNANQPGTAGAANTGSGGGGGGGSYNDGANGGSGVVILAYSNDVHYRVPTISAGLTYTLNTTSRAGYRVYRFTAGSGTITF